MNNKNAKKIRREVKKQFSKDFNAFSADFAAAINSRPLKGRVKFAWAVLRGKVD